MKYVAAILLSAACGANDPAARELVRVDSEPAGSNCASGGSAIKTGVDDDNNGVLDESEIESSTYVCGGDDGAQPLIRVDVEPAGANCAAGGSAIRVGIDANQDGMLSDIEITSTTYQCAPARPTVIEGSYYINNSIDAANFVGVTEVTGSVEVDATGLSTLDLSALTTVGGTFRIYSFTPNATVSVPSLTTANQVLVGGTFTNVAFPKLTTVTGSVQLNGMSSMTTLDLSKLQSVGGYASLTCGNGSYSPGLNIDNASKLTSLSLPALTTASGSVHINNAGSLTSLSFPVLTSVGELSVANAPVLTSLSLPKLATTQSLSVGSTGLTTLSFPLLTSTSSGFNVASNSALTSLSAPLLTTACLFWVRFNPQLPSCLVTPLAAQSGATSVALSGNDDNATCN